MRQRRQLLLRYRDELDRADEQMELRDAEEVERATEQWDASVVARLSDVDARVLGDVVAALRRLDDGTYGRCLTCGERIAGPRLDALPTAHLCIECADERRVTGPVTMPRDADVRRV
jgi:DnaK suppressor protein